MNVGYARVSTEGQNLDMQLDALTKADCIKIFEEKASGSRKKRPELDAMLEMLRPGDRVIVYKLDRIGRSMTHLIELVDYFNKNDIEFVSLQENIDTSTPAGRMFLHVMASLAEFEREMIVERTKSGLDAARARGRVGGRPKKDQKKIDTAVKMYQSKDFSIKEITKATGVSKTTLYRYLEEK